MKADSSSPAEGRGGLPSARAAPGATTLADSITPATNTAIAWARIGSTRCLPSLRLFINTLAPLEQWGLVFRNPCTVPGIFRYRQDSQILRAEESSIYSLRLYL